MKRNSSLSAVFIIAAASLWGTAGIFVRTLDGCGLTSMQLVFERAVFSLIILGAITLFKDPNLFKIRIKDLWCFAGSGIISIVMFNYCYYKTMELTSLSVAAVLLYTAPFFVVIMSLFLFKEKLTLKKCAACICAFIGCCFVSGLFASSQRITTAALCYGLLTGLGYSFYTVFGQILLKKGYHSLTVTFYTFLFAALGTVPLVNTAQTVAITFSSAKIFTVALLMAVINTVLPYILYTNGLAGVDASKAPIMATVEPVVATVIGTVVYHEKITVGTVIGIVLVLSAVVILNFKAGNRDEKLKAKS